MGGQRFKLKRRWFGPRITNKVLFSSSAAALVITVLGYLSQHTAWYIILPSFGASCVIIFVTPQSRFSRPQNIIGGHVLTSVIGIAMCNLFGCSWWGMALAVGIAIFLMQVFDIVHPPAAANPLLIMLQGEIAWGFVITPALMGSLVLAAAVIVHRTINSRISTSNASTSTNPGTMEAGTNDTGIWLKDSLAASNRK